jgi:predicted nucleic acid-binding protein
VSSYDRVFHHLVRAAGVDAWVTGDADLLAIRTGVELPILTAAELKNRLDVQCPP